MKKLLMLFCLVSSISALAQEWKPLFNGKDLQNWAHAGDGKFVIEDGMLKTEGGMGLLWYTPQKLENIRLKVVYKGAAANNAGVFIRIPEKPTEAWMPVNKGYEVQIDDREDEFHKTGVLYSLTKAKATPGKAEGWNEMIITLAGERTQVHVNGVLVTDYKEGDIVPKKAKDYEPDRGPRPTAGYVGLQNHGGDDVVYFREVSYQPLRK
ncbi:DUF1080 domain-containing protein [Rhodocytophaga rosea]|uniref:DUF1080 domain-containing protein n=1 Tax=Rhodocytophaga rosea TaxID=2704465 RepID=A0A6C0GKD3_9BACT|nr:DUF1080 domain-containing protein [Rhodocytophaga rosea]QHT68455.1 DUF1080 domain-containing protein [Rhodocytophaga rosea]